MKKPNNWIAALSVKFKMLSNESEGKINNMNAAFALQMHLFSS